MSATAAELVDMIAGGIQGELDLPDRLFEMRAGRHEAYLESVSDGVAYYKVYERGISDAIAVIKVMIEVETAVINSP